jgi:DNA replication protein DnaC
MLAADVGELLEIIEDRSMAGSVIITSQLPVGDWHGYLNQPVLADAVLDRLIHTAYRIHLKGESMRKVQSGQNDQLKMEEK